MSFQFFEDEEQDDHYKLNVQEPFEQMLRDRMDEARDPHND